MGTTTPLIKYNLKDRGRQHVGQPRNFDIRAICDAINSPATQERVATRGLVGYYGHMPRIRYGMQPVEGVMDGGKYVPIEPAFITTHLKADYSGNVEHRAEFVDTTAGRLALKLFDSAVGGFSSAIDTGKPEFHGLDYVLEPNFINNSYRGVVLDSVMHGAGTGVLSYGDVVAAEHDEQAQAMLVLLDSTNAAQQATHAANAAIERLQAENEQLMGLLMAKKGMSQAQALDSVYAAGVLPIAVASGRAQRMVRDTQTFRAAELPAFVEPENSQALAAAAQHRKDYPLYGRLLSQFVR